MRSDELEAAWSILTPLLYEIENNEVAQLQKSILQEIEQETEQTEDLLNVIKGLIVNVLRLEVEHWGCLISRHCGFIWRKNCQLSLMQLH